MDKNIGIGVIIGLLTFSSIYVWQSKNFSKTQKIILLISVVFAPLQWIGILIFSLYNKVNLENSPERISENKTEEINIKLNTTVKNLSELKQKGILTDEEYKQKIDKIETEKIEQDLKNSTEYKQLKNLLDSDVLTKEEFESKVEKLKNLPNKEIIIEEISEIDIQTNTIKNEPNDFEIWIYGVKVVFITILIFGILWLFISSFKK